MNSYYKKGCNKHVQINQYARDEEPFPHKKNFSYPKSRKLCKGLLSEEAEGSINNENSPILGVQA